MRESFFLGVFYVYHVNVLPYYYYLPVVQNQLLSFTQKRKEKAEDLPTLPSQHV